MQKGTVNQSITLITRADDCGSSHSANIGIAQTLERGFLKNISLMAPCGYIEEAARMLADRTDVCFGIHATLNAEWDQMKWGPVLPVSQVPSLVDEYGMFWPSPYELALVKPDLDEIMREFDAQLTRLRALGFRISYLDTHMAPEYEIAGLEERLNHWAKREGLLYWNRYCASLKPAARIEDLIEDMAARLRAAPPGQYLYVGHPAVDSPEMRKTGNKDYPGAFVARRRVEEAKLFTDPRILQICREREITPIRYDEAVELTDSLPPLHEWLHM
ncbi:ChbG/HpnK family deacetylase [Paenibacillaceae bacterium WGS1546]|uniref:ChbG/HpnK family deacetylase n=1 Tax=Cohnella sp. WGS1546 TaxID=3366810 RepID=UPI00372D6C86